MNPFRPRIGKVKGKNRQNQSSSVSSSNGSVVLAFSTPGTQNDCLSQLGAEKDITIVGLLRRGFAGLFRKFCPVSGTGQFEDGNIPGKGDERGLVKVRVGVAQRSCFASTACVNPLLPIFWRVCTLL